MEERKLNFNAPLLSVRRFSAALASSKGEKEKKSGNSVLHKRYSLPVNRSDASLDQVTEPVTVPFTWEHIPGKAKDGTEPEESKRCSEEAAVVPRLPQRRQSDAKENEKCSANEKGGFDSENDEEDAYSDALDALSQTDSLSLNCSVSGLSGSGTVVSKPSGTVSTDSQTRDFMMSRFLPAAKAMAMESPQYVLKKQPQAQPVEQQPRESRQVVYGDRKSPLNLYESMVVPHYDRGLDAEETASEDDDYIAPSNLSRKGCGFFPRLCFKNSLCLLNPVPLLKVRAHSSMTSLAKAGKPGKSAYIETRRQVLKKEARITLDKQKSSNRAQSPIKKIGSKLSSALSKFNYSGELQQKLDYGAQSPKATKICHASNKFTYSGELYRKLDYGAQSPKVPVIVRKVSSVSSHFPNSIEQRQQSDCGARSPKLPVILKKLCSESNHFRNSIDQQLKSASGAKSPKLSNSSDQQTSRSSSPYRSSGGRHISPYRRERPQSPFRGGGFLGLPKEAENFGSKSHELSYHQSSRQGSGSASPATEKLLYEDTANFAEVSSVRPNSFNRKGKKEFTSKSGPLSRSRVVGETAGADIKCLNVSESHNLSCEVDFKEVGECEGSPAPPPLPRKPSESWLRRALPSVPSQNQFMRTYTGSRFHPKMEETKAANAKWETIVKTSYLHHDHVRYSEELVTHVSQQPRN